jgi:hypothetical protein
MSQVIAAFSPFTWSIGQNYLALIAEQVLRTIPTEFNLFGTG